MSRKKKSNFAGLLGTNSRKNRPILREFHRNFQGKLHRKAVGKKRPNVWLFTGKISLEINGFALINQRFNVFLIEVIILLFQQCSIHSRNEPVAKPLTSWLVPSFLQLNLPLVVSGRCLHVSVTKLQDKVASLQQVNSPNS